MIKLDYQIKILIGFFLCKQEYNLPLKKRGRGGGGNLKKRGGLLTSAVLTKKNP